MQDVMYDLRRTDVAQENGALVVSYVGDCVHVPAHNDRDVTSLY